MFMVFPHVMHAQRFSVLITPKGFGHIVDNSYPLSAGSSNKDHSSAVKITSVSKL